MDTFSLGKPFAAKNVGQRYQKSSRCARSPAILLVTMTSWQQNFTKPGCALEFLMSSPPGSHWQLSRVCMQDQIYLPAWIRLLIMILIKSLWPLSLFSIKLSPSTSLRQKACFKEIYYSCMPQRSHLSPYGCVLILYYKHWMKGFPFGDKEFQASESKWKSYFRRTFSQSFWEPSVCLGLIPPFWKSYRLYCTHQAHSRQREFERVWPRSWNKLPSIHFID